MCDKDGDVYGFSSVVMRDGIYEPPFESGPSVFCTRGSTFLIWHAVHEAPHAAPRTSRRLLFEDLPRLRTATRFTQLPRGLEVLRFASAVHQRRHA